MKIYTNPRKDVMVEDWPYGSKRTKCHFYVEESKGKQRACRVTTNPKTGRDNKPKKLTYAIKVLFVDGDDGRTYVMQMVGFSISIMQSNMQLQEEYIGDQDDRYKALEQMFIDETLNQMKEKTP